jgi:pyoverdine/dityrosine biosynthesis protein Dit1
MKKISKSAGYAISWLHTQGKSIVDIAEELNIQENTVSEYIEKHYAQPKAVELSVKSSPVKGKKLGAKDLMIRHTSAKKSNNVAIMTQEASMLIDEKRKNIKPKRKNLDVGKECIFKPLNDK